MTSNGTNLNIVHVSDLHIGKAAIDPTHIHNNLKRYLYSKLNSNTDLLFITGDVWDTLLYLNSKAARVGLAIIGELNELALRYDFLLRVVDGTFRHDRKQNTAFTAGSDTENTKVYDCIAIEHIPKYDIDVLYLPDDLPYENTVLTAIREIVTSTLIDKTWVNIIAGHGYFEHVLPVGIPHVPNNTYTHRELSKFVNGPILFGHDHRRSQFKNVSYAGSFERLEHGAEDRKGFNCLTYNTTTHKTEVEFIENEQSVIFKTIDLTAHEDEEDIDDAVQKYIAWLDNVITGNNSEHKIYIRVATNNISLAQGLTGYTRTKPNVHITTKRPDKSKKANPNALIFEPSVLPVITPQNLDISVQKYLSEKGLILPVETITKILK